MDENKVIHCWARLEHSSLAYMTKNPVLLPANHCLSLLIIIDVHHKTMHSGIQSTLTHLWKSYCIQKGRESVKHFIKGCIICSWYSGKLFAVVPPPPLPQEKVDEAPQWSNAGVDCAGLLHVWKGSPNDDATEMVYIWLFTCAATRGLHLELVEGCLAEQFLRAFCCFASSRGLPRWLMSDNAKNVKSCCKEIENIHCSQQVKSHLANVGVSWKFIVKVAPWWGGFWRRLVHLTKDCLKRTIGRALLNFDEMHTSLVKIEAVLNARPLTYIYDDVEGILYPLSPSHLIYRRRISCTPNEDYNNIKSTNDSLTRRVRHQRRLLKQFTSCWSQEYLTNLFEKATPIKDGMKDKTAVGNIVFIKERGTARCWWKMAKIEELLPGRDGNIRAANIKVVSKEKCKPSMIRPVQLLIPTKVNSRNGNWTLTWNYFSWTQCVNAGSVENVQFVLRQLN